MVNYLCPKLFTCLGPRLREPLRGQAGQTGGAGRVAGAGGRDEATYPPDLHELGDHDDAEAVLLPNHSPEVIDHVLLRACVEKRGDERGRTEKKRGRKKTTGRRELGQ